MSRERIYHADVVRIVACLMVVLMHSPMPGPKLIPTFTSGLTYFTIPCVGLFLTLSGYLLLPVKCDPSESFSFAFKKVSKFIWPILIWSLIYLIANGTFISGEPLLIVRRLLSIPFYPQEGVLWYMYVLIGLYFVAPFISPWLQNVNKKTIQIYLLIWAFTLLLPYLTPFVSIQGGESGAFYYFSGYLGYFVLGYYLQTYDIKVKPLTAIVGILGCMAMYALYQLYLADTKLEFREVFGYLSIDSPILVVMWWNLLKIVSGKVKDANQTLKDRVVTLSNLSFGVYLAHILVMRYGLWQFKWIQNIDNYIVQTGVVFILTTIGTFLLVFVLSRLCIGKYFIAYKK